MGPQEEFTGVLKSLLKKKLEDKVLEILHNAERGVFNKKTKDYYELALNHGFTQEAEWLNAVRGLIADNWCSGQKDPPLPRNYPEKNLEDYLCEKNNLPKIEPGLSYVDRQYEIRAGRLDIFARDEKQKPVVIELKMGKYNPTDTFHQIRKYMNEQKDARVVFIAPKIDPHLFWGLQDYDDAERLTFYQVRKNGKEYEFEHITTANVPRPPELKDFIRKWKEQKDSEYARIPIRKAQTVNIEKVKKEGKQTGGQPKRRTKAAEQVKECPYEMILKNEGKKTAVKISEEQKKKLDELLMPKGLENAIASFNATSSWYVDLQQMIELGYKFENKEICPGIGQMTKKCKELDAGKIDDFKRFNEIISDFFYEQKAPRKTPEEMTKTVRELKEYMHSIKSNNTQMEYASALIEAEKTSTGELQKYIRGLAFITMNHSQLLAAELMEAKILRTQELMKINAVVAQNYFWSKPGVLLEQLHKTPQEARLLPHCIYGCISMDKAVYSSILKCIKPLGTDQIEQDIEPERPAFEDGERIEPATFHEQPEKTEKIPAMEELADVIYREFFDSPLYYKVLLLTRPLIKDREKYKSKIPITAEQKKELEKLVFSQGLKQALDHFENSPVKLFTYDQHIEMKQQGHEPRLLDGRELKDYNRGMTKVSELGRTSHEIVEKIYGALDAYHGGTYQLHLEEALELLSGHHERLREADTKIMNDKDLIDLSRLLSTIAKREKGKKLEFTQGLQFMAGMHGNEITEEMIDLKIKRAQALNNIDKELAASYLAFNPVLVTIMERRPGKIRLFPETMHTFAKKDTELYNEIVGQFEVLKFEDEEEIETGTFHEQNRNIDIEKLAEARRGLTSDDKSIYTHEEWDALPIHHKLFRQIFPEANPKKYFASLECTREQKGSLERLIIPDQMKDILEQYETRRDWAQEPDFMAELSKNLSPKIKSHPKSIQYHDGVVMHERQRTHLMLITSEAFLKHLCIALAPEKYESGIGELKEIIKDCTRAYHSFANDSKHNAQLQALLDLANETTGDEKTYFRGAYFKTLLPATALGYAWLAAKIPRTEALMQIDKKIAIAYFAFCISMDHNIKELGMDPEGALKQQLRHNQAYEILKRDSEVYRAFINEFRIREEQDIPKHQKASTVIPVEKETAIDPSSQLQTAITSNLTGYVLNEDNTIRIRYFVDDAAGRLSPERTGALCSSFEQSKLSRILRRAKERPSDLKIRNFFDDITLKYIRNEEVPDARALESLYERA